MRGTYKPTESTPKLWGYSHDSVVEPEGWRIETRKLRVLGVEDWHSKWHWSLDADVD